MKNTYQICSIILTASLLTASVSLAQTQVWQAMLEIPGTQKGVEFGLEFEPSELEDSIGRSKPRGFIVNGKERIEIPSVEFRFGYLHLRFPHYDSMIATQITRAEFLGGALKKDTLIRGDFKKRRGDEKWAEMKFVARQDQSVENENPEPFLGRWQVQFDSSEDPAVGIFERHGDTNKVVGTFLTSTGDYRYLGGYVKDGTLVLCCFDGAHAFRFEAALQETGKLSGQFWSSNTWHDKWTATKNDNAKIPDAFKQTTIKQQSGLDDLKFPDLRDTRRSLNDIAFQGKARLIYVFGSWCPNCHDAAAYFKELQDKYGPRGLKIVGLAFEVTSNYRRNVQQVKAYLKRHEVSYPVLVVGTADKAEASKKFPVLDQVRSYPTTIFIDGEGNVHAVHTGFTGPATGKSYEEMKQKFEAIIEKMLDQ